MVDSHGVPTFPLPHDETDVGVLEEAADVMSKQAEAFGGVRDALVSRTGSVVSEVEGDLVAPARISTRSPQGRAGDLSAAATAACATMAAYAAAVNKYNGVVDRLNREYNAAKAADFSVAADAGATESMNDQERQTARAQAIDAADVALRTQLGKQEQVARTELDRTGDTLAANLIGTPNQAIEGVINVLRTLGFVPKEDADGWGIAATVYGDAGQVFGAYAGWMEWVKYGFWQPKFRNAEGRWVWGTDKGWKWWQRLGLSLRPGAGERDWKAKTHQNAARKQWAAAGKWVGRVGVGVTVASSAWEQWQEDADNPDLDTADRVDRAATKGAGTAAGAFAGAKGGAALGAAIGTAFGPGPGTAIGAVVGGLAGGIIGGFAGGRAADWVNEKFGGIGHAVGDAGGAVWKSAGDAADAVGDSVSDAVGWVGGKLGF